MGEISRVGVAVALAVAVFLVAQGISVADAHLRQDSHKALVSSIELGDGSRQDRIRIDPEEKEEYKEKVKNSLKEPADSGSNHIDPVRAALMKLAAGANDAASKILGKIYDKGLQSEADKNGVWLPTDSDSVIYVNFYGVNVPVETNEGKSPNSDQCSEVYHDIKGSVMWYCGGQDLLRECGYWGNEECRINSVISWRHCADECYQKNSCTYSVYDGPAQVCELRAGSNWPESNCNEYKSEFVSGINGFGFKDCTYCSVTEWTPFSPCSVTCGSGTRARSRQIVRKPMNGEVCPFLDDVMTCFGDSYNCPVDCVVSTWSSWSTCSASCGNGDQSRTRNIVSQPQFGGQSCPHLSENQSCQIIGCARDCEISEWTAWSECAVTCGGGIVVRTRQVYSEGDPNGEQCPTDLEQSKGCGELACPNDVSLTFWEFALETH